MDLNNMKIGVMGGTFNPIHAGHLMLAEWAKEALELKRILFIPTGMPYMKEDEEVLPGNIRLQMVELAIRDNVSFDVSGMEIERGGKTYTCDTIAQLKREYPEASLYFIMGADCLFTIDKWRSPDVIFGNCEVVVAARNGSSMEEMECKRRELEEEYHAKIHLLQFPAMELSSTDIRERIAKGASIRYMVPDGVREYILQNHLYEI